MERLEERLAAQSLDEDDLLESLRVCAARTSCETSRMWGETKRSLQQFTSLLTTSSTTSTAVAPALKMLSIITVAPQHPSSPTLSLRSTTPLTFSPNADVLLESSDLPLQIYLQVDGSPVPAEEALESGCLVDIGSWFEEVRRACWEERTR